MALNSFKIFFESIRDFVSGKKNRNVFLSARQISELQKNNSCPHCGNTDAYLIFKESMIEEGTEEKIANFLCENCDRNVRIKL